MATDDLNVASIPWYLSTLKWIIVAFLLVTLLKRLISAKRFSLNKKKLSGKVVIITGANSGIGYATAIELAKRKARVILACRDRAKGEAAANNIRKIAKNPNVVFSQLDLASLASIRQFARMILTTETRLDALINNAGVMACPLTRSADGFEIQLAVNYLGHFLLTNLLINLIKKTSGSIVNVSSYLYKMGKINFGDLNSEKSYDEWKAYYQSKLALVLFTKELNKHLENCEATVNTVHPGMVATNLWRHSIFKLPGLRYLLSPLMWLMWKSPEEAALSITSLVVSDEMDGVSGLYFSNCKPQELEGHALDEHVASKLWETSVHLVGLQESNL